MMSEIPDEFTVNETLLSLPPGMSTTSLGNQITGLIKRRAELTRKLQQVERQTGREKRQLLLTLLDVADAFDRIFRSIDLSELDEMSRNLVDNFRTTNVMLENILDQEEVIPLEELEGRTFDPHTQEVIGVETQTDAPEGLVLEVRERGYYWHDKLLRPAKVIVSKKSG